MKYRCSICGYVYDETKEGVSFADLPDDWQCPLCGAPKAAFEPMEEAKTEEAKPSAPVVSQNMTDDDHDAHVKSSPKTPGISQFTFFTFWKT